MLHSLNSALENTSFTSSCSSSDSTSLFTAAPALPETDADAARGMAERIQRLIAELAIPHVDSKVADRVTASIGVGTVTPSGGGDARSLYREVDKLLYAAKQGGRNQVIARVI